MKLLQLAIKLVLLEEIIHNYYMEVFIVRAKAEMNSLLIYLRWE
jgi:hypothetical protein